MLLLHMADETPVYIPLSGLSQGVPPSGGARQGCRRRGGLHPASTTRTPGRPSPFRGYRPDSCRVEGRRVAGRGPVACPALSRRAAVRHPWARFLPPLSEPGAPISGTGLSSGIMRLAHGFPVATSGRVSRAVAPGSHPLRRLDRCAIRPVDALTTATTPAVPFACACADVRNCCSSPG